jgi:alanine racemase
VKTWVEISESRLLANYQALTAAAAPNTILPVIKANAYGHNATLCAPILARAGSQWLGIADASEGEAIRKALTNAGIASQPKILVMCGTLPEEAAAIINNKLTPVVWQQHQLESLTTALHQHGSNTTPWPIHLEIDTGMSRQGIAPGEHLQTLLHWLKRQPHLHLEGVLTHFTEPEVPNSPRTRTQRQRFEEAITAITSAGFHPQWIHAGNSSVLDNHDEDKNPTWLTKLAATVNAQPMVRPGIALYGYCLPIHSTTTFHPKLQPILKPVLTWKTRILTLQDVSPGASIGYNAIYTAPKPMRIALLPVGYSDGLRRELSGTNTKPGGWVLIHNQKAPIVGRISMNLTTIDVTHVPHAKPGDEVTLLGDNITADDHAARAHTISYEILCGLRALANLVP